MIDYIKGKIDNLTPTYVVVDVNGIGYRINISLNTFQSLQKDNQQKILTQFIVREDAQILYGFTTQQEKDMFNMLISVSGVGPSATMMMLSTLTPDEIASIIITGNSKALEKVKGIGTKTAQRIIVDLKDKVANFEISNAANFGGLENKTKNETLNALEVLGISKKMTEKIIDKILQENPETDLENLIKETLKRL